MMQKLNIFTREHYVKQMLYIAAYYIEHGIIPMREYIVDNFAGGGGASTGIELATGRSVDIAINHDPKAIMMHKANHPNTKHYCESVWDIDPLVVCKGQPVGLAWFSPDCKHFSKAKGGTPVEKEIRGLAWVAVRWASLVRPRVIMLENVEEFQTWGPLRAKRDKETGRCLVYDISDRNNIDDKKRKHKFRVAEKGEVIPYHLQVMEPDPRQKGKIFKRFVKSLESLGYVVESKEMIAADFGAPTNRKRFFLIARCDGQPIEWPKRTHAPMNSKEVEKGLYKPYVGAYTQIDFSRPCPSIFDSSEEIKEKYGLRANRPLADKTMQRIASGLQKFVIENKEPFIVQVNHSGSDWNYTNSMDEPLPVITSKNGFGIVDPVITPYISANRENHFGSNVEMPIHTVTGSNQHMLMTPTLIQYHSFENDGVRGQELTKPIMTLDGSNRYGLVASFLHKYYDGNYKGVGSSMKDPLHTITAIDHNSVCHVELQSSHIIQMNNHMIGTDIHTPINTITAGDGHFGEVRAFLTKYSRISRKMDEYEVENDTLLGTVTINGILYRIVDIGLRMLEPYELYGCQGFPDDYIIDRDFEGNKYSRTEQVKRCGNAVPPPFSKALVKANLPELYLCERVPNMRIDDRHEQLRFA